jgi:hypothetical protein
VTAIVSTRCRRCGAELSDRFSRKLGYGPECRKDLTPDQIADAVRANQPGYVPRAQPPQPASVQARINRSDALAAVDQVVECGCGSGALAGRCPECLAEQRDPMGVLAKRVARVIERVRALRTAERDARFEAWLAAHPPEPEQLALTDCHPLREEAS